MSKKVLRITFLLVAVLSVVAVSCYAHLLTVYHYQPVSVADFIYHIGNKPSKIYLERELYKQPLDENITVRVSTIQSTDDETPYHVDFGMESVFGAYYIDATEILLEEGFFGEERYTNNEKNEVVQCKIYSGCINGKNILMVISSELPKDSNGDPVAYFKGDSYISFFCPTEFGNNYYILHGNGKWKS